MGVIWGPIKIPKEADQRVLQLFRWEFWVYTNMGGYVAGHKGKIDCKSPELYDRCRSEEGIKVFLEWDKRSKEGRMVGAGAYLLKGNLQGKAFLGQVGIKR